MSRRRRFGHDYIYGIEHFEHFPEQYKRVAHRFAMADIDWCEFCGYTGCRKPVMFEEMFRDSVNGLDLSDKGVTVTRHIAKATGTPAYVVAYLTERPREVTAEIDRLNTRVLDLTRQWPIVRFRAQQISPKRGPTVTYTPGEWWALVVLRHSEHHRECPLAKRSGEQHASPAWMNRAQLYNRRVGLWSQTQLMLDGWEEAAS